MAAVLEPRLLLREALCCMLLGAALGALRACLPAKGRAAFVLDMLLVGALLALMQSFAAGVSGTGTLRWYMLAGGAAGALLAHRVLAAPLGALRARLGALRARLAALAAAPARFLRQNVLWAAQKRHNERVLRAKERRSEKKSAKKWKNTLQKQQHLLYNSNV